MLVVAYINSRRFRDLMQHAERKMLDQLAKSGDVDVRWHATWEMSAKGGQFFDILFVKFNFGRGSRSRAWRVPDG